MLVIYFICSSMNLVRIILVTKYLRVTTVPGLYGLNAMRIFMNKSLKELLYLLTGIDVDIYTMLLMQIPTVQVIIKIIFIFWSNYTYTDRTAVPTILAKVKHTPCLCEIY